MFICDWCDRQVAALAVGVYVQYGQEFAAAACPICGRSIWLRMFGQYAGGNGRRRYYSCSTHHAGHTGRCPKRFTVPADLVEQHILALVRADLAKLRDDDQLHNYVAQELLQASGDTAGTRERLQRRLAELDQQIAKLRDHLAALDPDTARSLGLYDQAKNVTAERSDVEKQLAQASRSVPQLPSATEIRRRATAAFEQLGEIIDGGTIEQKRDLIALYVQRVDADPSTNTLNIKLYPPLFNSIITGTA